MINNNMELWMHARRATNGFHVMTLPGLSGREEFEWGLLLSVLLINESNFCIFCGLLVKGLLPVYTFFLFLLYFIQSKFNYSAFKFL